MDMYLGIDPGISGAASIVGSNGGLYGVMEFHKSTWHEVSEAIEEWKGTYNIKFAVLEKVGAMPKQGVSSTFKFGRAAGTAYGLLVAHKLPFEEVSPNKWQSEMKCQTRGDKRITKAMAQQLFPGFKWTLKNSDAVLIAEYCRRIKNGK